MITATLHPGDPGADPTATEGRAIAHRGQAASLRYRALSTLTYSERTALEAAAACHDAAAQRLTRRADLAPRIDGLRQSAQAHREVAATRTALAAACDLAANYADTSQAAAFDLAQAAGHRAQAGASQREAETAERQVRALVDESVALGDDPDALEEVHP